MLCLAALTDLKTDRIPNGLIITGIIIGVFGSLWYRLDLLQLAVSMFLAFALMYPLFKIGALGAGDVKIFIMIGSFVDAKEFIMILVSAFVIGAVFSLFKLMIEHNGLYFKELFFRFEGAIFPQVDAGHTIWFHYIPKLHRFAAML